MTARLRSARPRLLPVLQYRDLPAAIAWLKRAFGFAEHEISCAEDGTVLHAMLRFGDALIMLGPVRTDPRGGTNTEAQTCYLVVDNVEKHYADAKAAGADILFELQHVDFGGCGYSCADPGGHIWNFGTYDPFKVAPRRINTLLGDKPPWLPVPAAVLAGIAAAGWFTSAALFLIPGAADRGAVAKLENKETQRAGQALAQVSKQAAAERDARLRFEEALSAEKKHAAAEAAARQSVEQALDEAKKETASEQERTRDTENALAEAKKETDAEREAKESLKQALAEKSNQATVERISKQRLEEKLAKLSKESAAEKQARQVAERAVTQAQGDAKRQRVAGETLKRQLQNAQSQLARGERELQSLQSALQTARLAKEAAERKAQDALKRLAEIAAAHATEHAAAPSKASEPVPAGTPAAASTAPPQKRQVTREAVEPMPPLIP
jgi:uncharacterized glyoxalase superfamily protein PhnB